MDEMKQNNVGNIQVILSNFSSLQSKLTHPIHYFLIKDASTTTTSVPLPIFLTLGTEEIVMTKTKRHP